MKKIGISLLCLLMLGLSACSKEKEYTRDTRKGNYIEITYDELNTKIDKGDKFIALVSQTTCDHCQKYKDEVLKEYLKNHHLDVYEVNITNEENPQECFTEIQNDVKKLVEDEDKQFYGTPYTLVVQKKKIKEGVSGIVSKDELEKIVVDYQLDEKKR